MYNKISFEPLTKADFPLLVKWLNENHVRAWYDGDKIWNEQSVEKKYLTYTERYKRLVIEENTIEKPIYPYIIRIDEVKVGYIQYYDSRSFPHEHGHDFDDLPQNTASLDMYIGEIDFLGKSLGPKIINLFLKDYVFKNYQYCLVDPDSSNLAAIKAYQKAGFSIISSNKFTLMLAEK